MILIIFIIILSFLGCSKQEKSSNQNSDSTKDNATNTTNSGNSQIKNNVASDTNRGPWDEEKIISEATGGEFKKAHGTYSDDCQKNIEYEAEVIDLNKDGQPEVFLLIRGGCVTGFVGTSMELYIKNKNGKWETQFGFDGWYNILETKNKGYPDIEIQGPGFCFPVWRWNGKRYDIFKKCDK